MATGAPERGGGVTGKKKLQDWNERITHPTLSGHTVSFMAVLSETTSTAGSCFLGGLNPALAPF